MKLPSLHGFLPVNSNPLACCQVYVQNILMVLVKCSGGGVGEVQPQTLEVGGCGRAIRALSAW